MVPKLHILLHSVVKLDMLTKEKAKVRATGYTHTWFDYKDSVLEELALFPSDEEIQAQSSPAWDKAEQLWQLLGVFVDDFKINGVHKSNFTFKTAADFYSSSEESDKDCDNSSNSSAQLEGDGDKGDRSNDQTGKSKQSVCLPGINSLFPEAFFEEASASRSDAIALETLLEHEQKANQHTFPWSGRGQQHVQFDLSLVHHTYCNWNRSSICEFSYSKLRFVARYVLMMVLQWESSSRVLQWGRRRSRRFHWKLASRHGLCACCTLTCS